MPSFNQRLGLNRYAADDLYRRALTAFSKRDFDRAVSLLNQAIEEVPRNPEYLATRGLIHLEEAEYDEAETDFNAALAINKAEMLGNYGIGMIAFKRRDYPQARRHLLAAHYVDTARPETLVALGAVFHAQGDYATAANYIGQANESFEKHGDKRKAETARWIRELSKFSASAQRPGAAQQPLPLQEHATAPTLPTSTGQPTAQPTQTLPAPPLPPRTG